MILWNTIRLYKLKYSQQCLLLEDDETTAQAAAEDSDQPGPSTYRATASRSRRQARRIASPASSPRTPISRRTPLPEGSSPGPSSSQQAASSTRRSNGTERTKQRGARSTPAVDFPTWMRLVQPLKFPYVAQLDDEVVYFRQGMPSLCFVHKF